MSIDQNTREILQEMGLNANEIDAYIALLKGEEMTAMKISKDAAVPYSKIYEVLNSLKEKGWIKISETRPFKYYPIPPIEATQFTKLKMEDKFSKWENTVAEELQPLYEKRELVERSDILFLRGQQAVLTKLEEAFSKATKEVVVAAPKFAKSIVTTAVPLLSNGLKKSVSVKLMAAGSRDEWLFLKKVGQVNEFRLRDHMFGGGVIVDGKEALLFLGEDKPNLIIWSNHLGLVGFAREYFQFLWDSSAKF